MPDSQGPGFDSQSEIPPKMTNESRDSILQGNSFWLKKQKKTDEYTKPIETQNDTLSQQIDQMEMEFHLDVAAVAVYNSAQTHKVSHTY